MNIVFTFLCAVFTGFEFLDYWSSRNCVRKKGSQLRLFVNHVFRLFVYITQTNSHYQFFAVQNAYNRCVLLHVMREGNHDLFGGITERHEMCGR
jgi:hypothetical protein